jgi:hypothetical protein
MNINAQLKDRIQDLYDSTPENVHGVAVSKKYKNGQDTGRFSIVFYVDKKLPRDQIPEGEMLPSTIMVDGSSVDTDVQEAARSTLVTCYSSGDPNIARLQPAQSGSALLNPMKGGQEIIQFPTGWTQNGSGWSAEVGTLGFFCVDDMDGKIVAVTNAHVVVKDYRFCSERSPDGYNAYDSAEWVMNPELGKWHPGAVSADASNPLVAVATQIEGQNGGRIKRYSGVSSIKTNYVDAAIMMMNAMVVDNDSYKIWGPMGVDLFARPMPFATTAEIDSLLVTNPRVLSTGRTSGPKGFTDSPSCNLRVNAIGLTANVDGNIYGDLIRYHYENGSSNPVLSGDSGSALVALIGGTYKIIGLVFAGDTENVTGNSTFGVACRIDRVADEMKIRAWDGSFDATDAVGANGFLTLPSNDARAGMTSFVHTDGHRYWQMGFRN